MIPVSPFESANDSESERTSPDQEKIDGVWTLEKKCILWKK